MRKGGARAKRATASLPETRPFDVGLHQGPTAPYDPLSAGMVDQIVNAAFELLATSGVNFELNGEVAELLRSGACDVGPTGIVRMPRHVVESALSTVARSTKLWNRAGDSFLEIDGRHTWFFPGMTCIKIFDLETGEPRESTREDLMTVARVADGLAHIDGVCLGVKNVTRSDIFGEIDEFAAMAESTGKPLLYLCENPETLPVVIDMAAAVRGSHAALADKPYFMHVVTPLPLNYALIHSQQVIAAARAGVPVAVGTLPIGGASSPITIAGSLMHTLATDLAAIVLGQLAKRGSFCIGASDVYFMEPASGGIGAFTQTSLADMAMCQIRRRLGIPSLASPGGAAVARRFNQDAVWEISSNLMQLFYTRPGLCIYLGSVDQGLTYSLHALMMSDDIAGMLRKLWQGIAVDEERIALELAQELGPLGNFLGQKHTAAHCRTEAWNSRYFGANIPVSTGGDVDRDLFERIDEDLRHLLATHKPAPLADDVIAKMNALQAAFAASFKQAA